MSEYYFDGKGKAVRPVVAMCVGHAYNKHIGDNTADIVNKQRQVGKSYYRK